jgi:hypothetical protein
MSYATCRGCDRAFTKDGWGSQSPAHPRLCRDCVASEIAYHGKHSPNTKCKEALL